MLSTPPTTTLRSLPHPSASFRRARSRRHLNLTRAAPEHVRCTEHTPCPCRPRRKKSSCLRRPSNLLSCASWLVYSTFLARQGGWWKCESRHHRGISHVSSSLNCASSRRRFLHPDGACLTTRTSHSPGRLTVRRPTFSGSTLVVAFVLGRHYVAGQRVINTAQSGVVIFRSG